MIENELIGYFKDLDENEKRNQINAELEKIWLMLDSVHNQYQIQKMESSIHPYNKVTDNNISNSDYFNLMYENIIYIRKDILTLVNTLLKLKS